MTSLTIREIARLAGTSTATVSRVLSGACYVSPDLAKRVTQVVSEQRFVPNAVASSRARLRSRRPGTAHRTIGVVVTAPPPEMPASHIEQELQAGIHAASVESNAVITSWRIEHEAFRKGLFPAALSEIPLDGILIWGVSNANYDAIRQLAPLVVCVASPQPDCKSPTVEADNGAGIDALFQYLYDLGHRRFEFLAQQVVHVPTQERGERFMAQVRAAGVSGRVVAAASDDFKSYAAEFAARRPTERPTALIAANDFRAARLLRDLGEQGVRVPEQVSVVGFDGAPFGLDLQPALTSWHPYWYDVGRIAFQTLLDVLAGKNVPVRTLIGGELLIRKSAAPP